jgi:DNA-binding transcriptional regulator YdaS (Cro superfamily)
MKKTPLDSALEQVRLSHLAAKLGITYQAIYKWQAAQRLPLTELSGETQYAALIEEATQGEVTRQELIEWSFPNRVREPCLHDEQAAD